MVANPAALKHGPNAGVLKMLAEMEAHATCGDWETVEELTVKLKAAVLDVPESQQRETLQAAQRSMEQIQTMAHDAKSDLAGKLSSIRRGKDATRAYTAAE